MKYLVLLVVLGVAYMVWRNARIERRRKPPARAAPPAPQDMVQCQTCAVHLPRGDALAGPDGALYCCAEHQPRAGR